MSKIVIYHLLWDISFCFSMWISLFYKCNTLRHIWFKLFRSVISIEVSTLYDVWQDIHEGVNERSSVGERKAIELLGLPFLSITTAVLWYYYDQRQLERISMQWYRWFEHTMNWCDVILFLNTDYVYWKLNLTNRSPTMNWHGVVVTSLEWWNYK